MNKKTFFGTICIIAALSFYSFKNNSGDESAKAVIVSLIANHGNLNGFCITYSGGKVENRHFKVKLLDLENQIEIQTKTADIIAELNEKGYHFAGTHLYIHGTIMVFEKK